MCEPQVLYKLEIPHAQVCIWYCVSPSSVPSVSLVLPYCSPQHRQCRQRQTRHAATISAQISHASALLLLSSRKLVKFIFQILFNSDHQGLPQTLAKQHKIRLTNLLCECGGSWLATLQVPSCSQFISHMPSDLA